MAVMHQATIMALAVGGPMADLTPRTGNPYHREPEPAGAYLAREERHRKDKDESALVSGKIGAKRRRRIARREARRAGK